MTTIAIPNELKNQLKEFGSKGETYSDILKRLIDGAKERQLQNLLMSEEDCIPIEDALKRAKKRWQK